MTKPIFGAGGGSPGRRRVRDAAGREQRRSARCACRAPPVAGAARRMAARVQAGRAGTARGDQAARLHHSGADDLGPWQYRHRRRRDPQGRRRLPRKAVRIQSSDPCRRARDRDRTAAAREPGAARPLRPGRGADRQQQCHQFGARHDQESSGDGQPRDDHRAGRRRQGSRRAYAPQLVGPPRWPVRHRDRRAHGARARRGGIVRASRARTASFARACSSRPMAALCSSTRSPTCR